MSRSPKKLSIKVRAKTFYFASLFFSKKVQSDISVLYSFCRLIDDIGDDNTNDPKNTKNKLLKIKKDLTSLNSNNEIVSDFIDLMLQCNINPLVPLDLVNGVISDLKKVDIKNLSELIEYSYKVAGTVGLMMCKIMNVKDKELKYHGIQLGVAMQLTNIARDIKEDLDRNRIYIPRDFRLNVNKNFEGLVENKLLQNKFSSDLEVLLQIADKIYNIAWIGIVNLPIKFRFPIAIASFLYQSIGTKIRIEKYNIWTKRIYLTKVEKFFKTFQVLFRLISKKKVIKDIKIEKKINKILTKFKSVNCD